MIKIGITGSIASGKTTASKIISSGNGPLFSADNVVKKLYVKNSFKKLVSKKLNFQLNLKFKKKVKNIIFKKENLKMLEKIIHPLVRKQMIVFLDKNKNKKMLFCEIPLLVENKLKKYFDVVIFIQSKKSLRLKRYKQKGGNEKLFSLLNRRQLKDAQKVIFCNHIVVNNSSLDLLKKKLLNIMKLYE